VTDRTYLERGEPVAVRIRWATVPPAAAAVIWHRPPRRNAPRNVLIERAGGRLVVRPFRGLRKGPDRPPAHTTHVLFNNCYRDYAQVNAQQLADLLSG
jgi:hypothetical protein